MKEQIGYQPNSEIKWPQGNKVEVGPDVDFVYIMRKDSEFSMTTIAKRLATDTNHDEETVSRVLLEEYDTFFAKLTNIFKWGYASKGNFELHLYDPDVLDEVVRNKSGGLPIVSLDPLMSDGVLEHKVSRGYYLGGKKDFGQVARPGSEYLSLQAQKIASCLDGKSVTVSEDDIFSGGSLITSLNKLLSQGVNVRKVVPGIQVGKPKKLFDMEIEVDPVVEYKTTDGTDIFEKVDLGDPRDYLLGASGLVVKLTADKLGRVPYIQPFVSTAARAGIPAEIEKDFALKVLQANFEFFQNIQEKSGSVLQLKHMEKSFMVTMQEMYGIDPNTKMSQVSIWLMDNLDSLWEKTLKQGEFQEKLSDLELPQNIVFLDVNGTLFADNSKDGFIAPEEASLLKGATYDLRKRGVSVGLCSDSPLTQLKELSERLGIDGPILAENGNLLHHKNKTLVLNTLEGIDNLKNTISDVAHNLGYQQVSDSIAQEFGGEPIGVKNTWSFGANRETSISVFGPAELINQLKTQIVQNEQNYSVDCDPEHNYFAVHPGVNFRTNKGQSLNKLSVYGHNIVMVGNSMSDWVEPEYGVKCAFVGEARIDSKVTGKASYVSNKPDIEGVIDILEKIE